MAKKKKKKLRKGTEYRGEDTPAARRAVAKLNAKGIAMAKESEEQERAAFYAIQEIRKNRALEKLKDVGESN